MFSADFLTVHVYGGHYQNLTDENRAGLQTHVHMCVGDSHLYDITDAGCTKKTSHTQLF